MADFDLTSAGDAIVLRASGLMAHADSGVFRVMLEKAIGGTDPAPLIVDLSGLEFICSTGMRLLVQFQRELEKSGRRMVTTGLSGTVAETMEICGIDKLLATCGTFGTAVDQVHAQS